jgi:HK97 gp10 family phage protein
MSSGINVNVIGFRELEAKIKLLANDKDKKREMLLILRQVAKPTLDASKTLVPISKKAHVARGKRINPRNLQKSLGLIQGRKGNAKDNPTIYVGARAKGSFDGWYAHFVHEGINVYRAGFKRKRARGANDSAAVSRTKGNPFLRKAYQQTQAGVTNDAEKRMAAFLQRRINKLA